MTNQPSTRRDAQDCIQAENLVVRYRVRAREEIPGERRARRRKLDVEAVKGVTFHVAPGEIVGFLGPNGAGKTSVMKCLSGLLRPTDGKVSVLGHRPHKRSVHFLNHITLIMGQRNQLLWDLPAMDTFLANKAIYRIPDARFRTVVDELTDVLRLSALLGKPVRQLSLGERARCEMAAALLHEPTVLFLDEPTLGLDVEGQQAVRQFLTYYREQRKATVLLTSHDMSDIAGVADRVLLIDGGRMRFEGDLSELVNQVVPDTVIRCRVPGDRLPRFEHPAEVWQEGDITCIRVMHRLVTPTVTRLLGELEVSDLVVAPPAVEDVLRKMITDGVPTSGAEVAETTGAHRA